jgi:hypothetical protein
MNYEGLVIKKEMKNAAIKIITDLTDPIKNKNFTAG